MDTKYEKLQTRFESAATLNVPTLLLHGTADDCLLAETTNGAERYFNGGYRRLLLEGVGHFPQREDPKNTVAMILDHLRIHS